MGRIITVVVISFGCLLLFGGIRETIRLTAEEKWPTVTGVVHSAKHFRSEGSMWVDVDVRYEVNGRAYSDVCSVDTESPTVPTAYQSNAAVTLHYDPTRPDHAYLQHAGYESPIALSIFGGVVLLIVSPFAYYFGLLLYADIMLRKAKYHMREGLRAISEGQDEVDAMRARGEDIPPELLEMERQLIEQVHTHHARLQEIENQRRDIN
ncbi:MAG: DUF3592 domain-containing protein [Pirellulaceae bacterium]